MSVHAGARVVLTWVVERKSATVTEANAATEVVMLLETLRMLADQQYTVLMTLVEGESFDILVGSGSGEGLEAWRRLHKTLGPLDDWKSKRIAQRNPFSWMCQAGRATRSSGTTGGLDEASHAKKRRTERSARYVSRRHQDGGVGSASS